MSMRSGKFTVIPTIMLMVAGVIAAAEFAWWLHGRTRENRGELQLAGLRNELSMLQQAEPAPTRDASEKLARQVTQSTAALSQAEKFWSKLAWSQVPQPRDKRTAYFELAHFRQRMTALAEREQVALTEVESFGFNAYRYEGPVEDEIARVHQQRLVLEDVLTLLFRAHPTKLLGVARESADQANQQREMRNAEVMSPLPTQLSLRRAGVVRSQALEIRFTGETNTLRAWLNALVASDLPVVVRTLSVQPMKSISRPVTKMSSGLELSNNGDGFQPLVQPAECEFVVSLEYVELVWSEVAQGGEA